MSQKSAPTRRLPAAARGGMYIHGAAGSCWQQPPRSPVPSDFTVRPPASNDVRTAMMVAAKRKVLMMLRCNQHAANAVKAHGEQGSWRRSSLAHAANS